MIFFNVLDESVQVRELEVAACKVGALLAN
jgi:hypothetical protein